MVPEDAEVNVYKGSLNHWITSDPPGPKIMREYILLEWKIPSYYIVATKEAIFRKHHSSLIAKDETVYITLQPKSKLNINVYPVA